MIRIRSDIWVSAWLRSVSSQGAMGVVVHKGSAEGGAISIKVNRLDGSFDLYMPAPQALYDEEGGPDRPFEKILDGVPETEVEARLRSELKFDQDLWIVECEDREGRAFLNQ